MDQYTDATTRGLGSRLMDSIKGIFFGLILFVVAFPLLWWNEGRAVKTARSLKEGERTVISVVADRVDPSNEGKLVHVTGRATTDEIVKDAMFGVSANAIKLRRDVQMYQWTEKSESETHKSAGGSQTTRTTYTYKLSWEGNPVDSEDFKHREGHQNPPMPLHSEDFAAGNVKVGAFRLSATLIARITGDAPVDVTQASAPDTLLRQARRIEDGFQSGDPAAPKAGDLRVTFKQVPQQDVSIIARQVQDTFEPYPTHAGRDIELLSMGTLSAESMFTTSEKENANLTWILRAVGFVLMFIGLMLVLRPLSTMGDVIPFVGGLVEFGAALFSGVVAICLSLVVISIAWILYRPLVGALLLVAACLAFFALTRARRSNAR